EPSRPVRLGSFNVPPTGRHICRGIPKGGVRTMNVRRFAVIGVTAGGLLACLASAQTPVVDDAALRHAGAGGAEWLTNGLDLAETRYSPLKQITTTNVDRLRPGWAYELASS